MISEALIDLVDVVEGLTYLFLCLQFGVYSDD
jgi:hypothetical protein